MIMIVFRGRTKPQYAEELKTVTANLLSIVEKQRGFVEYKEFVSSDGEEVNIIIFEDIESVKQWRENPVHRKAVKMGYAQWLETYDIAICRIERRYTREDRVLAVKNGEAEPS